MAKGPEIFFTMESIRSNLRQSNINSLSLGPDRATFHRDCRCFGTIKSLNVPAGVFKRKMVTHRCFFPFQVLKLKSTMEL